VFAGIAARLEADARVRCEVLPDGRAGPVGHGVAVDDAEARAA
jgi:hypothetical protein